MNRHDAGRRTLLLVPALLAAGIVLALMATVVVGAAATLRPMLDHEAEATAGAVGRDLARQVARAVQAGVPFDRLAGTQPWLEGVRATNPGIGFLAIADAGGAVLYATPPVTPEGGDWLVVPTPIALDGGTLGTVSVGMAPISLIRAGRQIAWELLTIAMLGTVLLFEVLRNWIQTRAIDPARRLSDLLAAGARGDFSNRLDGSSLPERALNDRLNTLGAGHQVVGEMAFAARAGHFDPAVLRRIDVIEQGIDASFRFRDVSHRPVLPARDGAAAFVAAAFALAEGLGAVLLLARLPDPTLTTAVLLFGLPWLGLWAAWRGGVSGGAKAVTLGALLAALGFGVAAFGPADIVWVFAARMVTAVGGMLAVGLRNQPLSPEPVVASYVVGAAAGALAMPWVAADRALLAVVVLALMAATSAPLMKIRPRPATRPGVLLPAIGVASAVAAGLAGVLLLPANAALAAGAAAALIWGAFHMILVVTGRAGQREVP